MCFAGTHPQAPVLGDPLQRQENLCDRDIREVSFYLLGSFQRARELSRLHFLMTLNAFPTTFSHDCCMVW